MKFLIFAITFFLILESQGQNILLPNEQIIFSFKTQTGKKLVLAKDSSNSYIIYRFVEKGKPAFQYPAKTKESWQKFTYSYYLRGGGKANDGMDLNYVYFINNGFRYLIYQTFYAAGNQSGIGVKVTNLKTKKQVDIKGNLKTISGTLSDFRFNGLLKTDEELPD